MAILSPVQSRVNPGESGPPLSGEKKHKVGTKREQFSCFGKRTAESTGGRNDSINPQMDSSCPHPTPAYGHTALLPATDPLRPQPTSRRSTHTTMFGFLLTMKEFKELGYQKADGFPGLASP